MHDINEHELLSDIDGQCLPHGREPELLLGLSFNKYGWCLRYYNRTYNYSLQYFWNEWVQRCFKGMKMPDNNLKGHLSYMLSPMHNLAETQIVINLECCKWPWGIIDTWAKDFIKYCNTRVKLSLKAVSKVSTALVRGLYWSCITEYNGWHTKLGEVNSKSRN